MINSFKAVLADDLDSLWYYIVGVFTNFLTKVACAVVTFFGLQTTGFYGDEFLIVLLFRLMLIDLLTGVLAALKTKTWNTYLFVVRGTRKFPVYAMYIFSVACIDYGVEHALSTKVLFVEMFVTYLIATEVHSILKHMEKMGLRIAKLLLRFTSGVKKTIEHKVEEIVVEGKAIETTTTITTTSTEEKKV
jgi:toxin secretion/phage lysis holin